MLRPWAVPSGLEGIGLSEATQGITGQKIELRALAKGYRFEPNRDAGIVAQGEKRTQQTG
jgi:hypothetical protein